MAAKYPEDTTSSLGDELLTCLICTEPFTNPKVLPCHHTFCMGCLDKYLVTLQQDGSMEPGTLPCPVCRQVVSVPCSDQMLNSTDLGDLADTSLSTSLSSSMNSLNLNTGSTSTPAKAITPIQSLVTKISSKKVYCDVCKYKKNEVQAKDHCASCGINYCDTCSKDHSKHCLFRSHSVVPVAQMEKSTLRCESHEAEMVKYYCMSCMAPLCTVCAVTDHQNHNTAELHDALGNKKDDILNKIAGMSEKVASLEEFLAQLEDVQNMKEASLKKTKLEVERHVNNLIGALHSRKHSIMDELDKMHDASMKQIAMEKENVAFQLANLKSLWKFAAKLTEPSQQLQMLAMHGDILKMVQNSLSQPEPGLPRECVLMNMFMPRQDLIVGNFQKCEMSSEVLARMPVTIVNGYHDPVPSPPRAQSPVPGQGGMPAPPMFFKDPFKSVPKVKWAASPKLIWKVNKIGAKVGEICESYDVTLLPDGSTIVAEWMNQRLQIFNENGKSMDIISPGQIQPWGVTVNREGNLAVTDDKDRTVKILSPTGQCIVSWKRQMFGWPRGVCENGLGQYIVADTEHGKHTVSIHMPDGRCVRKFGSQGTGNAQFHWPRYVTVDHDDRIIVSDGSNHCIKVFDPSGGFLFKFGSIGAEDGQMKHPRGICVDPQNNIIVCDQDNNRVTLFSPDGKFIRNLLALQKPWGVSVSEAGYMAVTQKPSVAVYKVFECFHDKGK